MSNKASNNILENRNTPTIKPLSFINCKEEIHDSNIEMSDSREFCNNNNKKIPVSQNQKQFKIPSIFNDNVKPIATSSTSNSRNDNLTSKITVNKPQQNKVIVLDDDDWNEDIFD